MTAIRQPPLPLPRDRTSADVTAVSCVHSSGFKDGKLVLNSLQNSFWGQGVIRSRQVILRMPVPFCTCACRRSRYNKASRRLVPSACNEAEEDCRSRAAGRSKDHMGVAQARQTCKPVPHTKNFTQKSGEDQRFLCFIEHVCTGLQSSAPAQ